MKIYTPINSGVTRKSEDFGLHIIVQRDGTYTVIGSGKDEGTEQKCKGRDKFKIKNKSTIPQMEAHF